MYYGLSTLDGTDLEEVRMKREEVEERLLKAIEIMLPIRGNLEGDMDDISALSIGVLMGMCLKIKLLLEEEKKVEKYNGQEN
jgi:hypothetical protein